MLRKGRCVLGIPPRKFKMAPEKLPFLIGKLSSNHLFFVLNFGRVSNLEVSDKSDSIELSIPIFGADGGKLWNGSKLTTWTWSLDEFRGK